MIDAELLQIFACPGCRGALELADPNLVAELNEQVKAKNLRTLNGSQVTESLEGGLICRNEKLFFGIFAGIPNLLLPEAIRVESPL